MSENAAGWQIAEFDRIILSPLTDIQTAAHKGAAVNPQNYRNIKVMATTLPAIAHYLENRNWVYNFDEDNSRIMTGVNAENVEGFLIVIQLTENGEYVQFIAPQLLQVKDQIFKGILFQTMLAINSEVKMLRFEYDPSDGEVRASIELPLEDAEFTERQFNRCLSSLIELVDEVAMPRLKTVLATGIDPGRKNLAARLLDGMPDELVNLLEQAIALRQEQHDI